MKKHRSQSDRTIHAEHPSGEQIVRYDRAGKWLIEFVPPRMRAARHIGVFEAAHRALYLDANGGVIHLGLAGGRAFDRKVEAIRNATLHH